MKTGLSVGFFFGGGGARRAERSRRRFCDRSSPCLSLPAGYPLFVAGRRTAPRPPAALGVGQRRSGASPRPVAAPAVTMRPTQPAADRAVVRREAGRARRAVRTGLAAGSAMRQEADSDRPTQPTRSCRGASGRAGWSRSECRCRCATAGA